MKQNFAFTHCVPEEEAEDKDGDECSEWRFIRVLTFDLEVDSFTKLIEVSETFPDCAAFLFTLLAHNQFQILIYYI